jgi:hypothetical protein
MTQEAKEKLFSTLRELGGDASIGLGGYWLSFKLDWNQEIPHIIVGLITALFCCAGVHYLKKLLKWIDKKLKI